MPIDVTSLETIEGPTVAGHAIVHIRPVGAALSAFTVDGRDIVRADSEQARVEAYSGVTLAPWPNRLAGASWEFQGRELAGTQNEPRGNGLHGLVYDRRFDVTERTTDSIRLSCLLGEDAVYPFAVRLDVLYALDRQGLSITYEVTNLGPIWAPIALGAHPYFPYDDSCQLHLMASSVFQNDEKLIPTGRMLSSSVIGVHPDGSTPLAGFRADDCFSGLARDAEGHARTSLLYGDGWTTTLWQDRAFPFIQIFTTPTFAFDTGVAPAIAIEPQTAPANALKSGIDLHWLQQAETWLVRWGIAVASPTAASS
ncbi:MAG: aldose epimerase family protein [Candidatus Nanopelagicales bacterium]